MPSKLNRREFTQTAISAAAATGAMVSTARAGRIIGANDRVRLGCIGVGYRGVQVLDAFNVHKDAEMVALCDVYEPYLNGEFSKAKPIWRDLTTQIPSHFPAWENAPAKHKDFRELLDRKDIDAVIIATPDHWHALQTVMACNAGKDVYCEKPLCTTIVEGRKMVEAARRNDRVVQVGTQRRSSPVYEQLGEVVRSGKIGKVTVARAFYHTNMYPKGIGIAPDSDPPAGLDWDMWLGPRAKRPYNMNILPYKFRWWHLYSTQMANWGIHSLDAMRWVLGETAPSSLSAHGGIYAVKDSRTIPDTAEVIFEHDSGMLIIWGTYESNGNQVLPSCETIRQPEIEFRGTLGTAYVTMSGFEVVPERGGTFQTRGPRMEPMKVQINSGYSDLDQRHARNFLDCVKSRSKPNADVEDGQRSTTYALLANISLATKSRIDWDHKAERVINNDKANELLHYEYREPWKLA
jgi:predicted dehydrogenase